MFKPDIVREYRKVVAHALASYGLNDMTTEVQGFKKRRLE